MISAIVTAFISFVSTNIDDIFVLMVFFSQVGAQMKKHHIIIGQYLGIIILLLISVLGSMGLNLVPQQYTGLLGIVPIMLGIKVWLEFRQEKKADAGSARAIMAETEAETRETYKDSLLHVHGANTGPEAPAPEQSKIKAVLSRVINPAILHVALVTIANGADNIGIYVPLFTRLNILELMVTIIVFLVLIAVWCFIGEQITSFPGIKGAIQKYKNIIVPVVFIGIGIFILIESDVFMFLTATPWE